jgi:hypothetical protein
LGDNAGNCPPFSRDPEQPDEPEWENPEQPIEAPERLYTPEQNELQLTVRAVVTGCLIGGIVGAMNISIGLQYSCRAPRPH